MLKAKIATVGLSVALGLSMVAPASAVTVAELQAQINALMAQLSSLQGGASVGTTFTADLTVGSTGAQVSALQQVLVSNGYLVMPSGVAMGYFGSLTKAAVMKWQAASGLPSTGFFGPMSRAKLNASGATGTVPGSTIGGSTSVGVITTPGVEGTLTVSKAASPASGTKLYENSSRVAVLGIELEAKTSDIKVERIKLDVDENGYGSDQDVYRKIAQKVYIMDGSTVLASMDLSTATVVEDGADRFFTVSGLSYVVPKDSKRVLTVALDARSNWDSVYDAKSWNIGVAYEGVRGVDGAGVNQYGPSTAFSASFTTEGELADSATMTVSTNTGTVQDSVVIAAEGFSENEKDGLELLKADFRAEKDAVTLTDLVVDITRSGSGTATATTAYLYDGSTLIGSETVVGTSATTMTATFDDIDYVISKDSTRTLTVKVDIDSANGTAATFAASIANGGIADENSNGSSVTTSGSAQGESVTVRNVGLEYTLVSKSVSRIAPAGFAGATSSLQADFVVRIKAVGAAVVIGDTGSTSYPFADNDGTATVGNSFVVYRGGAAVTLAGVSSSTSMTVPTGVSSTADANSWTLGEGNTVDIPLTFVLQGRSSTGAEVTSGAYAIGLERLNFRPVGGNNQSDNFMAGNSAWRTGTVVLP